MSAYLIAKDIHVTAVIATFVSFCVRGIWMMLGSPMLHRRWVRVLPHVIDTVLLASALYLAVAIFRYPMTPHAWITAKLIGLVAYIVAGTIAIKRGRTKGTRLAAFVVALLIFAYIVHTAVTKSVMPF